MIVYLKNLMYNPDSFANFVRGAVFAIGELPTMVDFGTAGSEVYWIGKVAQILAVTMRGNATK